VSKVFATSPGEKKRASFKRGSTEVKRRRKKKKEGNRVANSRGAWGTL